MLKSSDRKAIQQSSRSCFEVSNEPVIGIIFEKHDGVRRFFPYALLSFIKYEAEGLTFRFASGSVTARGEALEPLWNSACNGSLKRVSETGVDGGSGVTRVSEISVAEDEE